MSKSFRGWQIIKLEISWLAKKFTLAKTLRWRYQRASGSAQLCSAVTSCIGKLELTNAAYVFFKDMCVPSVILTSYR